MRVLRPAPVSIAWLATIGVDFLVFGGIAAGLLEEAGPAVLGRHDLFRRIPVGYASFLVLVVLLAWVIDGRAPETPSVGARIGGVLGAALGIAMAAGIWSFSTIPWGVLAAWSATVVLQLVAAGWVLVDVAARGRRAAWQAVAGFVVLVVLGLLAQNLG